MNESHERGELHAALGQDVPRETWQRLKQFEAIIREEAARQNLISARTLGDFWRRHIVDSAQLLRFGRAGHWVDLGSGAGLPGLVVAIIDPDRPVTLIEERRLRHELLSRVAQTLGLFNVGVLPARVERANVSPAADVISARAFAPLGKLLSLAHRFSRRDTVWVLPKGKSASEELASIRDAWHGAFRLEPSVTDPDSALIIATDVRPA